MICVGELGSARDYSFRNAGYGLRVSPVSCVFASGDQLPERRRRDCGPYSGRFTVLYGPHGRTLESSSLGSVVDVVA